MMNRRGLTNTRPYFLFLLLLFFGLVPMISHAQTPVQQPDPQAQAHRDKAIVLASQNDWKGAITELQAAYTLDQKNDPLSAAWDMTIMGACYDSLSEYDQVIDCDQKALPFFQKTSNIAGLAKALNSLGQAYSETSQYGKAINALQQALPFILKVKDISTQANTLMNLGMAFNHLSEYGKAISYFQQAMPLYQQLKDTDGQAAVLNSLGSTYQSLSNDNTAISLYRQSLSLYQRLKDNGGQARVLSNLGNIYNSLRKYDKVILFYQQALTIQQRLNDQAGQADTLNALGNASTSLSQYDKAILFHQQAVTLYQQVKDTDGQAIALNNTGNAYANLSRYATAIDCFQQALTLFQQTKNQDGQASALNNLGNASNEVSHYDQAIAFYQQALTIQRQLKDTDKQADALNGLGNAYNDLNQSSAAIGYFHQALTLYRQLKDREGQADALSNLGTVYEHINQYPRAIQFYQQALTLDRQVKNTETEANALLNLGIAYTNLHQYRKAISLYQQALLRYRKINDIDGQAGVLINAGSLCQDVSQHTQAISLFQRALPLFQQTGDRAGEALTLGNLMASWFHRSVPRLAVFYGKQAVNVYQSIRQDIQGMDKQTQKIYLKDKEPTYRNLAEILIRQGRLLEAEQVLGLLKDQEFSGFVQRDPTVLPAAQRTLPYDPTEQAQKDGYVTLSDDVTALGTQIEMIRRKKPLSLADAKQLTQLQDQLQPAQAKFQTFLSALPKELPEPKSDGPTPGQMLLNKSLQGPFQKTLFDLGPGTVALYTIVEPDKYRVVVLTSQTQIAREYPIKDTDLRAKVAAFRAVLQDPTRDPRPLAQELYKILIGPIAKDLQGAQATTLMWSLDDVLRYIPMTALYDGKQYLVERYRNTEFTGASLSGLDAAPPAQYSVLGLGVSKQHPGYPPLPGVPQELNGIVKEGTGSAGVMDGTVLLDDALTWDALKTDLNLAYPVVHIASHFALGADYAHSFLLLGDGPHSLDELSTQSQIFQSAALLTLSACETGVGNTGGDGREIESFGALAQEKGAQSIIASLWPVADASTPLLMDAFYGRLSQGSVSKGEALCLAQLSLLRGTVSGTSSSANRAEIVPDKKNQAAVDAPPFMPDPKAPFAHPYYWAPFILIGNWK